MPHLNRDPIVALGACITAVHTIVSRNVGPLDSAVITIGRVSSGTVANVIPDEAEMEGTIRTFDDEVREIVLRRLKEVLESTAAAYMCTCHLEIRNGYPVTRNSDDGVTKVERCALKIVPDSNHLNVNCGLSIL